MQQDGEDFPHAPTRPLGVADILAALAEDEARLSAPERDACRAASLLLREMFEPVARDLDGEASVSAETKPDPEPEPEG
jgi:hypothetical protein